MKKLLEPEMALVRGRGFAKSAVMLNSEQKICLDGFVYCCNLLLSQKSNRGVHAYLEEIKVFQCTMQHMFCFLVRPKTLCAFLGDFEPYKLLHFSSIQRDVIKEKKKKTLQLRCFHRLLASVGTTSTPVS